MENKCYICNKNEPKVCMDCYNSLDNQFDLFTKDIAAIFNDVAPILSDVREELERLLKEKK